MAPKHKFLKTGEAAKVPTELVRPDKVSLRDAQLESAEYQGVKASIASEGFLGCFTARIKTDPESGEQYYAILDGLQRFTACKELGFEEVMLQVVDKDDEDAMASQLMMNLHRVNNRPAEYGEQLKRLIRLNPLYTTATLAAKLGVSTQFITDRLALGGLTDKLRGLVDTGEIKLSNAYPLAKLPPDEQEMFMDRAMTLPAKEFAPLVTARVAEIAEGKRSGRGANPPAAWVPHAFFRPLSAVKETLESPAAVDGLLKQLPPSATLKDAIEIGIKFAINLDPASVAKQREVHEKQEADKAQSGVRLDAKRAAAKLKAIEEREAAVKAEASEKLKAAAAAGVDLAALNTEVAADLAKRREQLAARAKAKAEADAAAKAAPAPVQ